jgi:SAM-dependent methyltransferase
MNSNNQLKKRVSEEYDVFLDNVAALTSDYGESSITKYLVMYRARISSQILSQLEIITRDGLENGKVLSLGGWPGVAPIILNRITGIEATLLDHPALLTENMKQFYASMGLETVEFDFATAEQTPIPISGTYQLIECCQCIEHWNFSPILVFKQVFSSLLDPSGSLLITVPNATSLYRRMSVLVGQNPYPSMQAFIDVDGSKPGAEVSPHWREYTSKDLEMLVSHCGGLCTEVRTASYPIATNNSLSHRLYSLFNNLHPKLRENVEAVCKHHSAKEDSC